MWGIKPFNRLSGLETPLQLPPSPVRYTQKTLQGAGHVPDKQNAAAEARRKERTREPFQMLLFGCKLLNFLNKMIFLLLLLF